MFADISRVLFSHYEKNDFDDVDLDEVVTSFKHLKDLHLDNVKVTDVGIQQLAALPGLEYMSLERTPVGNDALEHLAKNNTKIRMLFLRDTNVTDVGLAHLRRFTTLEMLTLSGNMFTKESSKYLRTLPIKGLEIHGDFSDDDFSGLMVLATLPELYWLDLESTNLTDAGVVHLKELKQVKSMHLSSTRLSLEGVTELLESLPNCRIHCDWW